MKFIRCGRKVVLRNFQECFENVSRVFQESSKDISKKIEGCFMGV